MKTVLVISIICITAIYSHAQFNFGMSIGGNLPTAGMTLPGFVQVEKDGTQKAIVATLGAGININGAFGYQVNEHVAFNLDFGYFKSFKGGFHQYLDTDPSTETFENNGAKADIELRSTFTHVTPNVTIMAGSASSNWRPFARFGIILGSGTAETKTTITGLQGRDVMVHDGGFTAGFLGGLGLSKKINDKVQFNVEIASKTVTNYPETVTNTETFVGLEKAPKVTYRKELPPNYNGPDQLTFALPYSSIGLTLGLQYFFR